MVDRLEVLAVIPARGGSKGIPRKNIRDFAGAPLIAYSIAAGLRSGLVTRTIVSTDDEEIAAVAREYGAETPFLRPSELALDNTTDFPVFEHALRWLAENENYRPDIVVQLRPTSPVRPLTCVDDAIRMLLDHPEADSVRGVVEAGENPYKMWRFDPDSDTMKPLIGVDGIKEAYNAPRQILPKVYWQTGHIDAIRVSAIHQKHSLSGDVILGLVIDPKFTVDIDTLEDWKKYESLVKTGGLQMVDPVKLRRNWPVDPRLLVLDFDGVLTDNRVWVNEQGHEMIAANRSDSHGLALLRQETRIDAMVLSREVNPVVAARCRKMNLPVIQGVLEKGDALLQICSEKGIRPDQVIFMGNDVNDLPGFAVSGFTAAPADAQPEVIRRADLVLSLPGGRGAVRELCDTLREKYTIEPKA
jgi:N-acylneuraminate cytidylyltransferase